jgi:hypothetical protein
MRECADAKQIPLWQFFVWRSSSYRNAAPRPRVRPATPAVRWERCTAPQFFPTFAFDSILSGSAGTLKQPTLAFRLRIDRR